MKKSKAIEIIHKVIKTYEDCRIDFDAAEHVLDVIEKMGMLPPRKSKSMVSNPVKIKMIFNNFKWDKE